MLHLCASIVTAIELLSKDTEDFCQLSSVGCFSDVVFNFLYLNINYRTQL